MLNKVRLFDDRGKKQKLLTTKLLPSKRYSIVLLFLIVLWSITWGWTATLAVDRPLNIKSVDPLDKSDRLGQELYVENCSSCHIALPPEVLPTETWREILEKPEKHYGTTTPQILGPERLLVWKYLRSFSRALATDEPKPTYVEQSRYFKALHPQINLPKPVKVQNCVSCHPGVSKFDYRTLTPEWENSQ